MRYAVGLVLLGIAAFAAIIGVTVGWALTLPIVSVTAVPGWILLRSGPGPEPYDWERERALADHRARMAVHQLRRPLG